MCGGGVAGDATATSWQGCVGSTGRRSQLGPENGQRALRTSSGEEDRKAKRQEAEIKELRAILERCEKKDGEGAQGKAFHQGDKMVWRKSGELGVEDEIESRKKLG